MFWLDWASPPDLTAHVLGAARQSEYGASLVAQRIKNPPAMQVTQFHSLAWEDPLEKGMTTHFSILAWRIPWTERL